jgi:hypothetical protein
MYYSKDASGIIVLWAKHYCPSSAYLSDFHHPPNAASRALFFCRSRLLPHPSRVHARHNPVRADRTTDEQWQWQQRQQQHTSDQRAVP